jgi:hypothetical protein
MADLTSAAVSNTWVKGVKEPDTFPVADSLLTDKSLTTTDLEFLLHLKRRARGTKEAKITYEQAMELLGVTKRTLQRTIQNLYGEQARRKLPVARTAYLLTHSNEGFELAPGPKLGVRKCKKSRYVPCPVELLLARGLESWQKHLLLFVLSETGGGAPVPVAVREYSINWILSNCKIPGKGGKTARTRTVQTFFNDLVERGLVTVVEPATKSRSARVTIDVMGITTAFRDTTNEHTLYDQGTQGGTTNEHTQHDQRTHPSEPIPVTPKRIPGTSRVGEQEATVQPSGLVLMNTPVEAGEGPQSVNRHTDDIPTPATGTVPVPTPDSTDVFPPAARAISTQPAPGEESVGHQWTIQDVRLIEREARLGDSIINEGRLSCRLREQFPPVTGVVPEDVIAVALWEDVWSVDDYCLATLLATAGFVQLVKDQVPIRRNLEVLTNPANPRAFAGAVLDACEDGVRFDVLQLLDWEFRAPLRNIEHLLVCLYLEKYGAADVVMQVSGAVTTVLLPPGDRVRSLQEEWIRLMGLDGPTGAPSVPACQGRPAPPPPGRGCEDGALGFASVYAQAV